MYTVIARDYLQKRQYDNAEKLFLWLLQARQKMSGKQSKDVGDILSYLAEIKYNQKNYKNAEEYYRKSISILDQHHGNIPSCDKVAKQTLYSDFANCLRKEGKNTEALIWDSKAKAVYQK